MCVRCGCCSAVCLLLLFGLFICFGFVLICEFVVLVWVCLVLIAVLCYFAALLLCVLRQLLWLFVWGLFVLVVCVVVSV